jgi:REP element-mobilizing transposase RayT
MPNHVHLLVTPAVSLPKMMKSLKSITARRGNAMLSLTGKPFWQEESYDHLVRDDREFEKIRRYIEWNPVRAGLASNPADYRWSSANTVHLTIRICLTISTLRVRWRFRGRSG